MLCCGGTTLTSAPPEPGSNTASVVGVLHLCLWYLLACSVANVLFSALTLSLAIIGLHGALRVPDDLFLDETEVLRGDKQYVLAACLC